MQTIRCENPRCRKEVPKHIAQQFVDRDGIAHYTCLSMACLVEAILHDKEEKREYELFCEAIEQCR